MPLKFKMCWMQGKIIQMFMLIDSSLVGIGIHCATMLVFYWNKQFQLRGTYKGGGKSNFETSISQ